MVGIMYLVGIAGGSGSGKTTFAKRILEYDTVRPMHHEYLQPTSQFADLVVGEESEPAAEVVAARVRELIAGS